MRRALGWFELKLQSLAQDEAGKGDHVVAPLARPEEVERILGELQRSGREHAVVAGEQPVHQAITYLDNHRGMMAYATARAAGMPIGSGPVEATCKTLVEVRMKRAGSRWKTQTGAHVLKLRALALSDRWHDATDLALKTLRKSVRPLAA